MPNWCSNYLTVQGTENKINQVYEVFKAMQEQEEKTKEGQVPENMQSIDGYFFEIYLNEQQKQIIQFETRWCPNIDTLSSMAEKLEFDFVLEYDEMGNLLFGKYEFKEKELVHYYVTQEQSDEISYDEETDRYSFRGEEDETERNFLETLLEESIKQNHHL